jgi:hypothetical protein
MFPPVLGKRGHAPGFCQRDTPRRRFRPFSPFFAEVKRRPPQTFETTYLLGATPAQKTAKTGAKPVEADRSS